MLRHPYQSRATVSDFPCRTSNIGDQMITLEELKLVEKPETSLRVKDPKTGREGYRIGIEVFHQLHCLNLVRMGTFGDHYKGKGDFADKDETKIRDHIGMSLSFWWEIR
jgi:hypothetical protein